MKITMRAVAASCWVMFCSVATLTMPPSVALAQQQTYDTRVIAVPNSPIALTSCKVTDWSGTIGDFFSNLLNRTGREMLSAQVQFKAYDTDRTPIGSADIAYTIASPLAARDSNLYNAVTYINLAEPKSAVSYLTCRVLSATFTGRKTWFYGQRWREKLSPLP
jgi:hypothetical protein